jgi:hypothetical protein
MTVEATITSTTKPTRTRLRSVSVFWPAVMVLAVLLLPGVAWASRPPTAQERREIVAVSQHIQRAAGAEPHVGVSNLRVTDNGSWALATVTLRFQDGPPDSALAIYQRVRRHWIVTAHSPGTGYGIQCGIGMPVSAMRELGAGTSCPDAASPGGDVLATTARQAPRLGRPWGPYQIGYGKVRPTWIFNGGDPTGEVEHIHWTGWGSSEAIGEGDAEYVWPGTSVAANSTTSGARVVAFHLGTCRGHPSYNAVEWYFPKYGQTFNPGDYINICSGRYIGDTPPETECADVSLADGAGMATEVKAIHMSCAAASAIIAETNTTQFGAGEGRFVQAGFRCGTEGSVGLPNSLFDCQMGGQEFLFWAET